MPKFLKYYVVVFYIYKEKRMQRIVRNRWNKFIYFTLFNVLIT